jgi:hypothetical protein
MRHHRPDPRRVDGGGAFRDPCPRRRTRIQRQRDNHRGRGQLRQSQLRGQHDFSRPRHNYRQGGRRDRAHRRHPGHRIMYSMTATMSGLYVEYRRCRSRSTRARAARIRNHAMSAKPQPLDFVARTAAASAAMTVSQCVEMALTHRPGSELPVRVVEALIGRGVPTGAQAVAGQFVQATLAALALGSPKWHTAFRLFLRWRSTYCS